ncbi:hypothetical protein ACFLYU_03245 [Candidatus Dependentiae bacterium]
MQYTRNTTLTLIFIGMSISFPNIISCVNKPNNPEIKNKSCFKKALTIAKKTSKAAVYATAGICATANYAISAFGLFVFFKNMKKINNSYISNPVMKLAKYAFKIFSEFPSAKKYIVPGAIFTLSASMACSFYASCKMFKKAYTIIKS